LDALKTAKNINEKSKIVNELFDELDKHESNKNEIVI
jgi:hypothetical protein